MKTLDFGIEGIVHVQRTVCSWCIVIAYYSTQDGILARAVGGHYHSSGVATTIQSIPRNKKSPTGKSGSGQASTTSPKRWRRGAGNGLAMYFAWRRTAIHTQHWHGLHLGRGAATDRRAPWDCQLRQRWREQGRTGMNSGGLPKIGLDGEALLTSYARSTGSEEDWLTDWTTILLRPALDELLATKYLSTCQTQPYLIERQIAASKASCGIDFQSTNSFRQTSHIQHGTQGQRPESPAITLDPPKVHYQFNVNPQFCCCRCTFATTKSMFVTVSTVTDFQRQR